MLVRMINAGRWSKEIPRKGALFTGDIIADLRTQGNTISTWYSPDGIANIDDIALALSSNRDNFDKLSLVLLDEDILRELGISFKQVPANNSPVKDENVTSLHHDLIDIDFWHLGYLAEYIKKQVDEGKNCKSYTKKQIQSIIEIAYQNKRLSVENLSDKIRNYLNGLAS